MGFATDGLAGSTNETARRNIANPTARQRVDRSSPFYQHCANPLIARSAPEERCVASSKDLNDPHAAAVWDSAMMVSGFYQ